MQLRDYQTEAVNSLYSYFRNHKEGNPILGIPTGAGKTLVIAGFIKDVLTRWSDQKIVICTHVKEIIKQNHTKMMQLWPQCPAGIYSAGLRRKDLYRNVTFSGIGSIHRNPSLFADTNLLIVDEADMVSPSDTTMYLKFINGIKEFNPRLRVIGLTATPWRSKSGLLTEGDGIFTDICFDMTSVSNFNWLLDEGYLVPLIPKQTNTFLDVSGVKTSGDEYNQKQLQAAVDDHDLTLAALEEVCSYIGNERKSWLIFCSGIEHSIHTASIANDLDIPCGIVHSGNKEFKMSTEERDSQIAKFESHEYKAITNNSVLSVGYDNTKIDLIVHLRPGRSSRKWVQELGRGTRPDYAAGFDLTTKQGRLDSIYASGKHNCMVMDYGRNTPRLGPINDPVIPGSKRHSSMRGGGDGPVKECPNCQVYIPAGSKECFHCGYLYPDTLNIETSAGTKELIKKIEEPPRIETFNVQYVTYKKHETKATVRPSLKVTYCSGLANFTEYVAMESPRAVQHCRAWWIQRSQTPVPSNVDEALTQVNRLKVPAQLSVWTNKKYPEIVRHIF